MAEVKFYLPGTSNIPKGKPTPLPCSQRNKISPTARGKVGFLRKSMRCPK
jgi:hypothetical protein